MIDIHHSSGDVFRDLGFGPSESEKLRIKSQLMQTVENVIAERKLTQSQAAELMGVSRPRISDAVRGKIEKFTIDALVDMLARAGIKVEVTVRAA